MIKSLVLALACSVAAHEEPAAEQGPSEVHVLTDATFGEFVDTHPLSLIEFYAPWCGHCKALAPHYDAASLVLKDVAPLAKVDCTTETKTCESLGVQGYPTLKIFRNSKPSDYPGQRTEEAIVEIMTRQTLPAVTTLTDNHDTFSQSAKVVVVGYFAKDSPEAEQFKLAADDLRDDFVFATTDDASVAEKAGVKIPAVVLYKQFDDKKAVFDGKLDVRSIEDFVKAQSVPLMDDISPENYSKYISSGKPIAYFFHETAEQKAELGPLFEKVAKDYVGDIIFLYLDASKYGPHADAVGLEQKWPAFSIHKVDANEKFPLDQTKDITADAVSAHVKAFSEGKLESFVKSEEVPETNDGPVKKIVGHTFDYLVLDTDRDVFVEFYAPWCGHCKKLAPIWEELGTSITNPDIMIAKVDATLNDIPGVNIQGFPTLILFKAGDNTQVVFEEADRSLEALTKFLKQHTSLGGDDVAVEEDVKEEL